MNNETVEEDAVAWMDARGFKDVLLAAQRMQIDFGKEYEFMRREWDSPSVFRLRDCHPAMNLCGLRFRPVDMGAVIS